jgi:ribosomal protein L11 methyltransferase
MDDRERYQLVLANILSGPLTELAPALARCCSDGADIVLSGILSEQADAVRRAYSEFFDMHKTQTLEEWVLLHGTRKS